MKDMTKAWGEGLIGRLDNLRPTKLHALLGTAALLSRSMLTRAVMIRRGPRSELVEPSGAMVDLI